MENYDNVLELKNVIKNYKYFSLKDITFNLPKGMVMGLIGPNGAGKTTLIKSIMGLLKVNSGDIKVFNKNIKDNEIFIKDKIGFVYDDCYAFEEFSLEENKKIISSFYSKWNEEKYKNYIKIFNLNSKKKLKELSKGQKMRFSLAIALSHSSELLILDEPTSGLDPVFRSELLDILFNLIGEEEISILYSTHITNDLEKLADYITFINDGKLQFSIEKDTLLDNHFLVKGPLDILDKSIESKFIGVKRNKYNFEALTDNKICVKELGDKVILEKANLDDIIVYYSKHKEV